MKSSRSEPGATAQVEREAKYSAWPGFEVPDLTAAIEGLELRARGETELDATYYDTADLRLIRRGVTLRRRIGPDGPVWTVKFPEPSDSTVLRRQEIDLPTDDLEVPARHASLVRAYARRDPLVEVARLRTRRCSSDLVIGGTPVGSVDDDEVDVIEGEFVSARFREIELEVRPEADEGVLTTLGAVLEAAGAGAADPTPKLVRALGPRALAPPELAIAALTADATMGQAVERAIRLAVAGVLDADHVLGLDLDPEGVHQARVEARRLRSMLRVFAPVLDLDAEPLRAELAWFVDELGPCRDADVLVSSLAELVEGLGDPTDRARGEVLVQRARAVRDDAHSRLVASLDSDRYLDLLDRLVELAERPAWTAAADTLAVDELPPLLQRPWRNLSRAATDLEADATDDAFHRVRIRVRRARYAVEVAAPLFDDPACDLGRALGAAQDLLGAMHDAAEAESWLRSVATSGSTDDALVGGQLVARLASRSAAARDEWPAAWATATKRSRTGWLTS